MNTLQGNFKSGTKRELKLIVDKTIPGVGSVNLNEYDGIGAIQT